MKKLSVSIIIVFICFWVKAQNDLVSYEYWFNNDYANVIGNTFSTASSHELDTDIDVSSLPDGINILNIRYKNQNNIYSSTLSKMFYKNTEQLIVNKNLTGYEYWFNNDFDNVTRTDITPSSSNIFIADLDISSLPDGVNSFNVRYIDEQGKYSSTLSKVFLKNSELLSGGKNLTTYQYWFNNDFGNKTEVAFASSNEHLFVADLDISTLPDGVNIFNIRYKDERGVFSTTFSKMFLKYENNLSDVNNLVGYQYWFNNDYGNVSNVAVNPAKEHTMIASIDISSLPEGVNTINIRYRDANGLYCPTITKIFYKAKHLVSNNKITGYKYWFDDDVENAVFVGNNNEESSIDVDILIDLTRFPKGEHVLNIQFRDSIGYFSVIKSDTIIKTSLPIADFDFLASFSDCDSTEILFSNKSIDGDVYSWDFGDGQTDTAKNPKHWYFSPGDYSVSLTTTDTITWADSTFNRTVSITGKTSGNTIVSACDSYLSPSGKHVYTTSGIYVDTLTNQWGCDSLLTIDLTINSTKYKTDIITSCGPYLWIDGVTYSESNYTATYTLQTITGCDSIVTLNLTVNHNR